MSGEPGSDPAAAGAPSEAAEIKQLLSQIAHVRGFRDRRLAKQALERVIELADTSHEGIAALTELADHPDHGMQRHARQSIERLLADPGRWRVVFQTWQDARPAWAEAALRVSGRVPPADHTTAGLLLLLFEGAGLIADPEHVVAVLDAAHDGDPRLTSAADAWLLQPRHTAALTVHWLDSGSERARVWLEAHVTEVAHVLAEVWSTTRHVGIQSLLRDQDVAWDGREPRLVAFLLALGRGDIIAVKDREVLRALVECADDRDETVAGLAQQRLIGTAHRGALELCFARWRELGSAGARSVVAQRRDYSPNSEASALIAVLRGDHGALVERGATVVDWLYGLAEAPDGDLRDSAGVALCHLQSEAARAEIMQRAVEGDARALQTARDAGYVPDGDVARAGFFFLTEQWDRYEALDFDGRLLSAFYLGADEQMRVRMRDLARASGRAQATGLLLGGDRRARARQLTRLEARYLVDALLDGNNPARAWTLALDLPVHWAAEVARRLMQAEWRAPTDREHDLCARLAELDPARLTPATSFAGHLPAAVPMQTIGSLGRSYSISFAPDSMTLGIGLWGGRAGLWDLQFGELLWARADLSEHIGALLHIGDETLLIGGAATDPRPCGVMRVDRRASYCVGKHASGVLALVSVNGAAISFSRDGYVGTWGPDGLISQRNVLEGTHVRRPHHVAFAPDGRLALLDRGVAIVDPAGYSGPLECFEPTSPTACSFAPDGDTLLVGERSGLVTSYRIQAGTMRAVARLVTLASKVVAITVVPSRHRVIAAAFDGTLVTLSWPRGEVVATIKVERKITGLVVSPSGDLMATTHPDGATTMWDLRSADLPSVLAAPLMEAVPAHLSLLDDADFSRLPAEARAHAELVVDLLRFRFRHNIELSAPVDGIRRGQFDVLLV